MPWFRKYMGPKEGGRPIWIPGRSFCSAASRMPLQYPHALHGVERVIHLASAVGVGQSMYQIVDYCRTNVMGTATLLQAIIDSKMPLKSLVVASSMSVYGEGRYRDGDGGLVNPELRSEAQLAASDWEMRDQTGKELQPVPTDEAKPLAPASVYAINKRDQEEMCLKVGTAYGIPTTALRFFNVYGSRQALSNPYTGVAAIFCARLLNDRPPLVFEDGLQQTGFRPCAGRRASDYFSRRETFTRRGHQYRLGNGRLGNRDR